MVSDAIERLLSCITVTYKLFVIRLLAHNNDELGPSTSQEGSASNVKSETNTSSSTVAKSYKCEE